MPSISDPIADHRANRRVRSDTMLLVESHARSAYASTPNGRVTAVLRCSEPQIPGSGWTWPNPVICPIPTQPDHTATAAGTEVLILTQDLHIRIISKATGELLRELTLDPSRDYQPTGRPPGPTRRTP